MTKMKSKKMTKSTFAIIIMGIVMVAMLAFGGTFAYFTAQNAKATSGELKTGKVVLGVNSIANVTTDTVVTNTKIADSVSVASQSNVNTVVVVEFAVTFNGAAAEQSVISFTQSEGWITSGKYLLKAVDANTASVPVCGAITFVGSSKATTDDKGTVTYDNDYMDKTLEITIQSWAVQADNVTGYDGTLTTTNASTVLTALGLAA